MLHDVDSQTIEADEKLMDQAPLEEISIPSKSSLAEPTVRSIPPPGSGQRIYEIDPYLLAHKGHLDYR